MVAIENESGDPNRIAKKNALQTRLYRKRIEENYIMRLNNKRGSITAAILAIAGFIFVTANFMANAITIPSFPAFLILRIFIGKWAVGDAFVIYPYLIIIANPLLYGVVGYLIGLFSKSRQQIFCITGLLAIILLFSSLYFHLIGPYIEHSRSINRMKQQAIKKLEANPNDIYALHWMGVHHLTRTRQYQEAEKYFRRVVELETYGCDFSTFVQRSLIHLAIIYQSQGKHDKAEYYYRQFIATDPDLKDDLVLLNYSNQYLRRRDNHENKRY